MMRLSIPALSLVACFAVYWPGSTAYAESAAGSPTLRDLLRHSGGLPCEPDRTVWSDPDSLYPSRAELIERVPTLTMSYPAGTDFNYSNLGYSLLGEVVSTSTVSGMEYADHVQENAAFFTQRHLESNLRPGGPVDCRGVPLGSSPALPASIGPEDHGLLVSVGPLTLAPDAVNEVPVASGGGEDLIDLLANADRAQELYAPATALDPSVSPVRFVTRLLPNRPNPFNPTTTLHFDLARSMTIELTLIRDGKRTAGPAGAVVEKLVRRRSSDGD